jgi:hypothetical protein
VSDYRLEQASIVIPDWKGISKLSSQLIDPWEASLLFILAIPEFDQLLSKSSEALSSSYTPYNSYFYL